MKTCKICNRSLDVICFSGRSLRCKACENERAREMRKANPEKARENERKKREANPAKYAEIARKSSRKYEMTHREERRDKCRTYRKTHPEKALAWNKANPEKVRAIQRKHNAAHPEKRSKAHCKWALKEYANNPAYRIEMLCRHRLNKVLQRGDKSAKTMELIGCTREHLKQHIEAQFRRYMHWDNQGTGRGKWHIDHIIPCSKFDLTKPEQQRICFHFTNLRPLWSVSNMKKSDRWTGTLPLLVC